MLSLCALPAADAPFLPIALPLSGGDPPPILFLRAPAQLAKIKYGRMTSEALDFIEPRIRMVSKVRAGLPGLRTELHRRFGVVSAAHAAYEGLSSMLSDAPAVVRLPMLVELGRRPTLLCPPPPSVLGCGHDLMKRFHAARHRLYNVLVGLLSSSSASQAEQRLILSALQLPYSAHDIGWIESAGLIRLIRKVVADFPSEASLALYSILASVVRAGVEGAGEAADAAQPSRGQPLWVAHELLEQITSVRVERTMRIRCLHLLVLWLPSTPDTPLGGELVQAAAPRLFSLASTIVDDDEVRMLCLRLIARLLSGLKTGPRGLEGAPELSSMATTVLGELGQAIWRPQDGRLSDVPTSPPTDATEGSTGAAASTKLSRSVVLEARLRSARRQMWGQAPRVLRKSKLDGLLLVMPQTTSSAAGAQSATPLRALRLPLTRTIASHAAHMKAYLLPAKSCKSGGSSSDAPDNSTILRWIHEKPPVGPHASSGVSKALEHMEETSITQNVAAGTMEISTPVDPSAVLILFPGSAGMGWTCPLTAVERKLSSSKFCAKWFANDGGQLGEDGTVCEFTSDGMRLVETGHVPHSGIWRIEFKIKAGASRFDPDGAYVGVMWVPENTPPSERRSRQFEIPCFPGRGARTWGWRAQGSTRMEGRDGITDGNVWKVGDIVILTLDTAAMTVQRGRKPGGEGPILEVGPSVQLPDLASRSAAIHFAVGRYFGNFQVQIASLSCVKSVPGGTSDHSNQLLMRPLVLEPVTLGGIVTTIGNLQMHDFEDEVLCEEVRDQGARELNVDARRSEAIVFVRQLLLQQARGGAEGQLNEALLVCQGALRAACEDSPSSWHIQLAAGTLYAIAAREDVLRRGAIGVATRAGGSSAATSASLVVTDSHGESPSVAWVQPSVVDDSTQVTLGREQRTALQLELPCQKLPHANQLLPAIAALIEHHLGRSGVVASAGAGGHGDGQQQLSSHASLTMCSLGMMAAESLLVAQALPTEEILGSTPLLRSVLSVCSAPLPPLPMDHDSRWVGRASLWYSAVEHAQRLQAGSSGSVMSVSLLHPPVGARITATAMLPEPNGGNRRRALLRASQLGHVECRVSGSPSALERMPLLTVLTGASSPAVDDSSELYPGLREGMRVMVDGFGEATVIGFTKRAGKMCIQIKYPSGQTYHCKREALTPIGQATATDAKPSVDYAGCMPTLREVCLVLDKETPAGLAFELHSVDAKALTIKSVKSNSVAARAGLMAGELVLAINELTAPLTCEQATQALEAAPSSLTLVVHSLSAAEESKNSPLPDSLPLTNLSVDLVGIDGRQHVGAAAAYATPTGKGNGDGTGVNPSGATSRAALLDGALSPQQVPSWLRAVHDFGFNLAILPHSEGVVAAADEFEASNQPFAVAVISQEAAAELAWSCTQQFALWSTQMLPAHPPKMIQKGNLNADAPPQTTDLNSKGGARSLRTSERQTTSQLAAEVSRALREATLSDLGLGAPPPRTKVPWLVWQLVQSLGPSLGSVAKQVYEGWLSHGSQGSAPFAAQAPPGEEAGSADDKEIKPENKTSSSSQEDLNKLFDGNMKTYWQSNSTQKPHWIELSGGFGSHSSALIEFAVYIDGTHNSYALKTVNIQVTRSGGSAVWETVRRGLTLQSGPSGWIKLLTSDHADLSDVTGVRLESLDGHGTNCRSARSKEPRLEPRNSPT